MNKWDFATCYPKPVVALRKDGETLPILYECRVVVEDLLDIVLRKRKLRTACVQSKVIHYHWHLPAVLQCLPNSSRSSTASYYAPQSLDIVWTQ